ncbi:MAG: 2-dehydropantoate 2-reductase [Candidatus Omnitrophota bacterium]
MKITVVGPGALGCLIGGFLAKAGEDVWFLDKHPERADKLNNKGIRIEGISGEHNVKVKAACEPKDIKAADLVIICVKSYDTEEAAKNTKTMVSDNTLVLTLQNGFGNIELISEIVGQEKVIGAVTAHGSTSLGDGHIKHAGKGETIIGRYYQPPVRKGVKKWQIPRRRLEEVASILRKANFETKVSDNIKEIIWSKLIINVGINALTAITRLKNGGLLEHEWTKNVMRQAVLEATKVAKRRRISLIYSDPIKKVESICSSTADNLSSMLQDILRKKRTEVDYINGAIVSEGENLEIPTPVNSVLTDLVKAIEGSYSKQILTE